MVQAEQGGGGGGEGSDETPLVTIVRGLEKNGLERRPYAAKDARSPPLLSRLECSPRTYRPALHSAQHSKLQRMGSGRMGDGVVRSYKGRSGRMSPRHSTMEFGLPPPSPGAYNSSLNTDNLPRLTLNQEQRSQVNHPTTPSSYWATLRHPFSWTTSRRTSTTCASSSSNASSAHRFHTQPTDLPLSLFYDTRVCHLPKITEEVKQWVSSEWSSSTNNRLLNPQIHA